MQRPQRQAALQVRNGDGPDAELGALGADKGRRRRTEFIPFDWRKRVGFEVCERARDLGMLTRPLLDVVVYMPPLSSTPEELREMVAILEESIVDVTDR